MGRTDLPAALNGPQYIAGRGTTDPAFRAKGDIVRVRPRRGWITLDERAEKSLQVVAEP